MTAIETKEELKMIEEIEAGKWKSLGGEKFLKEKEKSMQIAENTIKLKTRKKPLNIRLFEEDILKIKSKALREGIPYQTYLSSMIHKFVNSDSFKK